MTSTPDYAGTCPTQVYRHSGGKQHKGHDRCIRQKKHLDAVIRDAQYRMRMHAKEQARKEEALRKQYAPEHERSAGDVVDDSGSDTANTVDASRRKGRPRQKAKVRNGKTRTPNDN